MKKLLVIEDDEAQARSIARQLEALGYEAVYVLSGAEAMKRVGTERYDCILVDYCMPQMDGVEFVRTLRSLGSKLPVIIVTALECAVVEKVVDDLEVWNVLAKPLDAKELGKSVEDAVEWGEMPPEVATELAEKIDHETREIGKLARNLDEETRILPPLKGVL